MKREEDGRLYIRTRGLLLTPFVKYKKDHFDTFEQYTSEWDIDKIRADMPIWAARLTRVKVYIMMNNAKNHSRICYVGASEDLESRVNQHNGYRKGGPSETRKAMGKWRTVFYCELPPIRNFRASDIVGKCSSMRGGPHAKLMKAVEVCMDFSIKFKVSRLIFKEGSDFYSNKYSEEIKKIIPSSKLDGSEGYLF